MKSLQIAVLTAAIGAFPLSAALAAGSGSDVQPQTQSAAVPGASTNTGTVTTNPASGTSGGGMTTGSGRKMGGMNKKNKVHTAGASQ